LEFLGCNKPYNLKRLFFGNTTKIGRINTNLIISDTMLPPHPDPLPRGEREVYMDLQGEEIQIIYCIQAEEFL